MYLWGGKRGHPSPFSFSALRGTRISVSSKYVSINSFGAANITVDNEERVVWTEQRKSRYKNKTSNTRLGVKSKIQYLFLRLIYIQMIYFFLRFPRTVTRIHQIVRETQCYCVRLYDIDHRYGNKMIGIELLFSSFLLLTRLQAKNSIIALRAEHTLYVRVYIRTQALTWCSIITRFQQLNVQLLRTRIQ